MKFQTQFGAHRQVNLDFDPENEPSLTHQSFQDQSDINVIMAKYQRTGLIEHVNQHQGNYGDYLHASDYHTSMNEVILAQDMFMTLPSSIRKKFDNDPAEFLAFVEDPKNRQEMVDLGLVDSTSVQNSSDNSVQNEQSSDA